MNQLRQLLLVFLGLPSLFLLALFIIPDQVRANCAVTISGTNVICGGHSNNWAHLGAYGSGQAQAYQWSNGATTASISVQITQTTTFTVTVTFASGCTATDDHTVNFSPPIQPVITPSVSGPYCFGQVVQLNVTHNQSNGPYTYQWSSGETGSTINAEFQNSGHPPVPQLQRWITVRDANNCPGQTMLTLTGENFTANITTDSLDFILCEGEELNLKGTITSNNFTIASYNWSNGATTSQIMVNNAGNYTVTVTTTQGCSRQAFRNIPALLPLPQPVALGQDFLCVNKTTTLDVAGGEFKSYIWSGGLPAIKSPTISQPGTYTVTVEAANGCLNSSSVTVNPGLTPPIFIVGPEVICSSPAQNLTLSVGGANNLVKYRWNTKEETPTATISSIGNYFVTVTNDQGCSAVNSWRVLSGDITLASINGPNNMCIGDTINLRVVQDFAEYQWSNNATTKTISVTEPGQYTAVVTNTNGCTALATYNVGQKNVNMNLSKVEPICPGDTAILRVTGSGLSAYRWSNGQTTASTKVTRPGQYTVTVVDNTGCGGAGSIRVASKFVDTTRIRMLPYACDGIARLFVRPDSLSIFGWSTTDSIPQINVSKTGRYSIKITSKEGCVTTDSMMVKVPDVPKMDILREGALCPNTNEMVSLSATSGFERYRWNTGDTLPNISVNQSGTYIVEAWDKQGCMATQTVQVGTASLLDPIISIAPYACDGQQSVSVNADYSAYSWSNGTTTPVIAVVNAGEYFVTVTNAEGCTKTTQIFVPEPPSQAKVSISGGNAFCPGGNSTLQALDGFNTYTWSTGANTDQLTVTQAGTYIVTATDANGCSSTAARTVDQLPLQPVVIRGATSICTGRQSVFTVQGNWQSYQWSTGASSSAINVSQAGTYTITTTNDAGCSGTAAIVLTVNDTLTPSVNQLPYQCDGQITLDAGSGYANYLWSDGSTNRTLKTNTTGYYTVKVSDFSGCNGSKLLFVEVPKVLELNVEAPVSFCEGASVKAISTEGFVTYTWNDGVNTAERQISEGGKYTLIATDINGCSKTAGIDVQEIPNPTLKVNGPTMICTGQEDFLYLETNAQTYTWSDGSKLPYLEIKGGGEYSITVSNNAGCTAQAAVLIEESTVLPANVQQTYDCKGGMNLAAQEGYNDYNWSLGANTPNVLVKQSGTYELIVTNKDGCTAETSVQVAIPAPFVANVEVSDVNVCDGTPATLTANSNMGAYEWSTGETTANIKVNTDGVYRVIVTDTNGCTDETEINVQLTDKQPPVITCPANQKRCFSDRTVTFTLPQATDNCNKLSLVQTEGLPSESVYPEGITINSWEVKDGFGNVATCSFSIEILPGANLSLVSLGNDKGNSKQGFIDVSVEGKNQPFTFEWSRNGQPFATTEDLQNVEEGSYSLVVRDANNCLVANQTFTVSNTSGTNLVAAGNSLTLLPNPVRDQLTLQLEQVPTQAYGLQLFDLNGRLLFEQYDLLDQVSVINMSQWPQGTYTLSFISMNRSWLFKVVKISE